MIPKHADLKVFLHPGEFYFSDGPAHIHTLLGSCISVTLWHPRLHIGGACHFVLPKRAFSTANNEPDGRYGDEAMELFRRAVTARGTRLSEYKAKIFGGSNMLGNTSANEDELIGMRNAEAALTLLMEENVEILVVHVGETGHRRIFMDTATGDVYVRHEAMDGHVLSAVSGVN